MGWAVGYDSNWKRDVGYGVPATCDHPGCGAKIDRGLSYLCGDDLYGGEKGCGLFFCEKHADYYNKRLSGTIETVRLCRRCATSKKPYTPTPDTTIWIRHKLRDASWKEWRNENPDEVLACAAILVARRICKTKRKAT